MIRHTLILQNEMNQRTIGATLSEPINLTLMFFYQYLFFFSKRNEIFEKCKYTRVYRIIRKLQNTGRSAFTERTRPRNCIPSRTIICFLQYFFSDFNPSPPPKKKKKKLLPIILRETRNSKELCFSQYFSL